MIHWLWAVFTFIFGVIAGIFLMAYEEVSHEEDKPKRKWWEE